MDRFLIAKDPSSKSTMCVLICQFIPRKPQPSQWPDQFKGERKGHKSAKIILLFKLQFHGKFLSFKLKTPIPKFYGFVLQWQVYDMIHRHHFLISPFVATPVSHK